MTLVEARRAAATAIRDNVPADKEMSDVRIGPDDIWSKTDYIRSSGLRTIERDGYRLEQLGLPCECPNCDQYGHWHTQKREKIVEALHDPC